MQQIRQAVTDQSLFLELQTWCSDGAGRRADVLQILSAFATGAAVEALEPFFEVFLADGNRIDIIVGIDRNGTSRDAIQMLDQLQRAYADRMSCFVFYAPSAFAIFHPKLYLHRTAGRLSAVVGSGNLTLGGLSNNFESLFAFRDISSRSRTGRELIQTWNTFAKPRPPLRSRFLRPLSPQYVRSLLKRLPRSSRFETSGRRDGVNELWRPISHLVLPRSNLPAQRRQSVAKTPMRSFMLIDVLKETRRTQMQLPLAVVEEFFGVPRDAEASIQLSQVRGGTVTQPIERRLVISKGQSGSRLMRRIEMPQIAGQPRPLAATFVRTSRSRFSVAIFPRSSQAYRWVDQTLRDNGQQPDYARRRYYIGHHADPLVRKVRRLLASV